MYIETHEIKHGGAGGAAITQPSDNKGGNFRALMNEILNYVRSCESYKKLCKTVKDKKYWCNSTELWARLVEVYWVYCVGDHVPYRFELDKDENEYLVKSKSYYQNKAAYLTRDEVERIAPKMYMFFGMVSDLLNGKKVRSPKLKKR